MTVKKPTENADKSIMRAYMQRLIDAARPGGSPAETAFQLRLLMAMAYADGRLGDVELEALVDFVDRAARGTREHDRLIAMVDELAARPPSADEVLAEARRFADQPGFGRQVVSDLAAMAGADGIDHREAFLLDLVSETFGFGPADLVHDEDDAAATLQDLVQQLVSGNRRAA